MAYSCGLDWGEAAHALCVIDESGRVVLRLAVQHTAEGIKAMLERLARIAPPAELPIAIERPSGLLVDALLEAGHPVDHFKIFEAHVLRDLFPLPLVGRG